MIVVTGGAGMIGSNLIKKLNEMGDAEILVVDDLTRGEKINNLKNCKFSDYIDKGDFIEFLNDDAEPISHIFHFGACSSTAEKNGFYLMKNNFEYSKKIAKACLLKNIKLIYASSAAVYSRQKSDFSETSINEGPENPYGFSKLAFDNYLRYLNKKHMLSRIIGLRFFNVYGPNESHKLGMSSPVFSFNHSLADMQKIKIFKGSHGFEAGKHARDFVHVNDCINVALWAAFEFDGFGIFNVGTGVATSFLDVARIIIKIRGLNTNENIEYVSIPESISSGYQPYTKANLKNLRLAGYKKEFMDIEHGIESYISYLCDIRN